MEQTLVVLKPDTVQRGLVGPIIDRFERKGLKIVAMKMLKLSDARAKRMYKVHEGKSFHGPLMDFITSSPVVAIVLEGENAIATARQLMGATKSSEAQGGTIRGDWGMSQRLNLVHGSDSLESAKREIPIFFRANEILKYKRTSDKWVSGK